MTSIIHVCDVTWLIHVSIHMCNVHQLFMCVMWHDSFMCLMWHDSPMWVYTGVTCLIHMKNDTCWMCAPLKSRVTTHPLIHISTHSNIQYPHKQVKSHLSPRACTHAASHICSLPKELYSLPKESSILLKERFRMATIRSMPNLHMLFSTKEPCLLPKEPSIPLKSATGWRRYVGCLIFRGHSPKQSPVSYGVATISRLVKIIGLFCKRAL